MNTNFLNKDLSIIYSIGDEELIFENNKLFVLFSGPNTCSSCIYNAFEAINEVEFLKGNDFIYTLSWENKFNRELILIDSTYLTLELFTNSYSPTLFILDRNYYVKDIFLFDGNIKNNITSAIKFLDSNTTNAY